VDADGGNRRRKTTVETVCAGNRRSLDWAVERRVWRRCLDGGADKRALRGFDFFQFFQNQVKIIKSKQMPSLDLKIPKKIVRLDSNIIHNFLNCANFKFPREIKLKIWEHIQ
jgi:hypothetical protein